VDFLRKSDFTRLVVYLMSEVKKFGPYKGSAQNGGRPIYVYKKNKARADYESKNGKLPRDTDVDHKDNNKKNDSKGNLRAMSHSKNVGKENKRRAGKKSK
jgi:hypothetical protein